MKSKLKTIKSTQMFSPIKDVRHGVIVTRDERFVKLLEVKPINFSLRSVREQNEVISNFAAALRNFPNKTHFKIISRRSDIAPFIDQLRKDMASEPVAAVRKQQAEQIDLVTRIGTTMGISRRFFMDFEYTEEDQFAKSPTFDTVVTKLTRDALSIKNSLAACGNDVIINNSDDYILSTLYSMMARNESIKAPFSQREIDVVSRYAATGVDLDGEVSLPINDFISPLRIDPAPSPKYIIIDGQYYMFCYIPSDAYPIRAYGGWLMPFLNFAEGVDVDIWFEKESVEKTKNKLDMGMRFNHATMTDADDLDRNFGKVMAAAQSAYYIKQGVDSGDEVGNFAVMFTVIADTLDELDYKYKELRRLCTRSDLKLKQSLFQMPDAFVSTMPICQCNKDIFKKSRRNILVSQFASVYPFTSFELSDENGTLIGVNGNNNSLVFLDIYDTTKYNNANTLILGSPGGGKTYLAQLMALRMRAKGIQVFSIVALKGYEYERACRAVGGQFIRIDPDSPQNINIMEIRKRSNTESVLVAGSAASKSSILIGKVQQLHRFYQILLPDMTAEERQTLDEALIGTYKAFGITQDNDSLNDPANPGMYRAMPILGDLFEQLESCGSKASRLANVLKRFVVGSASSFNQPTNIDLDNKYTIFDVSNMSEEMRPIGLFIATEFVWDKIKEDPSKKKALFMEECWRLGQIVIEIFKIIRGYGGAAIAVTQEITDTFSSANKELSSTLVATSEIKIVMKTKPKEAEIIGRELDLSEQEVEAITTFRERGQCLLAASSNHVYMQVQGNRTEHDLITTDRRDYERLEREGANQSA